MKYSSLMNNVAGFRLVGVSLLISDLVVCVTGDGVRLSAWIFVLSPPLIRDEIICLPSLTVFVQGLPDSNRIASNSETPSINYLFERWSIHYHRKLSCETLLLNLQPLCFPASMEKKWKRESWTKSIVLSGAWKGWSMGPTDFKVCHKQQRVLYLMLKHLTQSQLNAFTWRTLAKATTSSVFGEGKERKKERLFIGRYPDSPWDTEYYGVKPWLDHASLHSSIECTVPLSGGSRIAVTAAFYSAKQSHITSVLSLYLESLRRELAKVISAKEIPVF